MVRSHHGLAVRQCWPAAAMPHTLSSVTLYSQHVSRMHELLKEPRPREGSGTKDAAYSSDLNPPQLHGASLTLPLPLAASWCSQLLCLPHCLLTLLTPIKPKVYITISVKIVWLPFPWHTLNQFTTQSKRWTWKNQTKVNYSPSSPKSYQPQRHSNSLLVHQASVSWVQQGPGIAPPTRLHYLPMT